MIFPTPPETETGATNSVPTMYTVYESTSYLVQYVFFTISIVSFFSTRDQTTQYSPKCVCHDRNPSRLSHPSLVL